MKNLVMWTNKYLIVCGSTVKICCQVDQIYLGFFLGKALLLSLHCLPPSVQTCQSHPRLAPILEIGPNVLTWLKISPFSNLMASRLK